MTGFRDSRYSYRHTELTTAVRYTDSYAGHSNNTHYHHDGRLGQSFRVTDSGDIVYTIR